MINIILLSLSDNDKRIIFALLIVVILVLVLIGYLSYLLVKLMKWQGKKMDTLIYDVVKSGVITNRRHLLSYGRKKNWALFFKQAYVPILIAILGGIILIIRDSIYNDFTYNPFSVENGFGSLFFTFKLSGELVGGEFIKFNKIVVDNYPHFIAEAWAGYIACPCFLLGATWYFLAVTSLVARTLKLHKRSREVFEKSLDNYTANETLNPNQTQQINNNNNNVPPTNL